MVAPWGIGVAVIAFFLLLPVFWICQFIAFYSRRSRTGDRGRRLPPAVVILPLRGADPSLSGCLRGLLRQNYPDFDVHIIIDSWDDPAWRVVRSVLAGGFGDARTVRVEVLENPRPTCSLKVSAQLQAIARLDERVEVIAMIDADSVPAPGWLRAMVEPLLEPGVGASTGIRWFAPPADSWGALVRHLYNAASIPQMYAFNLPWGGSLAFRASVVRRSRLPEHWSRCFCEDESCGDVLRELGLRLAFVPEATHINRESITLPQCRAFLLRQLLCLRLHHRTWPVIVAANFGTGAAQVATVLLLLAGLLGGDARLALAMAALAGLHLVGLGLGLRVGEFLVRRVAAGRGEAVPPPPSSWHLLPAAAFTQALSLWVMLRACCVRRVDWRGVSYLIEGKDNIRLLEYRPYRAPEPAAETNLSVV